VYKGIGYPVAIGYKGNLSHLAISESLSVFKVSVVLALVLVCRVGANN